jgi:hypothetical protein
MPKKKRKPTPAINAYSMSTWGNETFGRLFIESIHGLDEEAEAIGFPGLSADEVDEWMGSNFPVEQRHKGGPTQSATAAIFFIKIVAYLKEPVTKALVEIASSEFFKLIFSKLGKMFKTKPTGRDVIQYPVMFKPSMFFQAEQVMVTVLMPINKPEDYKDAEKLVPLAFERAVAWLERNGRQDRYLTYRVVNGQLNSFPTISPDPVNI